MPCMHDHHLELVQFKCTGDDLVCVDMHMNIERDIPANSQSCDGS